MNRVWRIIKVVCSRFWNLSCSGFSCYLRYIAEIQIYHRLNKAYRHVASWQTSTNESVQFFFFYDLLPSWKLTYPIPRPFWRWFPFPKVGYVRSLEGIYLNLPFEKNMSSHARVMMKKARYLHGPRKIFKRLVGLHRGWKNYPFIGILINHC